MVCLPGEGTIHFSTNCPKIINIGESTPLEVVWIGCELTTSNFQPKQSSLERRRPEQEKQQGMRMLTAGRSAVEENTHQVGKGRCEKSQSRI